MRTPTRRALAALSVLHALGAAACSSDLRGMDAGPDVARGVDARTPADVPLVVDDAPPSDAPVVAPADAGMPPGLPFPAAPPLGDVRVAANRDSAILSLPAVPGARDYRVFRIDPGVTLDVDAAGHEGVRGAVIYCAGYRQRNAAAATHPPALLRDVQVNGLDGPGTLVVEAIDTVCPFAGIEGARHEDIAVTNDEVPPADRQAFSFYTEAEIRARYGSLIVNGHGPAAVLGQPAPPVAPRVLARAIVTVTPRGRAAPPPVTQFFDDFADADQPTRISAVDDMGRSQFGAYYRNTRWSFYTYGAERTQFFIARGQMHTVIADWAQDVFSTNVLYPRQPVHVADADYLHVVFDVESDATSRRYWWLSLCGAETAGHTMNPDGSLQAPIVQTPFFYDPDGRNPSTAGWNCFQIFPRSGSPFTLPPDDTAPESDLRVMVNQADRAARDSVVNVSPQPYPSANIAPPSWYRQHDAAGRPTAPILDDQMLVSPATHYELYLRRDRAVLYVNGAQRLCNDFGAVRLTMAEGALGFGQVLYHTTAERLEYSVDFWDRTAQRYYLENTPYADARGWDNLGYDEHAAMPAGFDPTRCHVYAP